MESEGSKDGKVGELRGNQGWKVRLMIGNEWMGSRGSECK